MVTYHEIAKVVAPKRARLRYAEANLRRAQAQLQTTEEELQGKRAGVSLAGGGWQTWSVLCVPQPPILCQGVFPALLLPTTSRQAGAKLLHQMECAWNQRSWKVSLLDSGPGCATAPIPLPSAGGGAGKVRGGPGGEAAAAGRRRGDAGQVGDGAGTHRGPHGGAGAVGPAERVGGRRGAEARLYSTGLHCRMPWKSRNRPLLGEFLARNYSGATPPAWCGGSACLPDTPETSLPLGMVEFSLTEAGRQCVQRGCVPVVLRSVQPGHPITLSQSTPRGGGWLTVFSTFMVISLGSGLVFGRVDAIVPLSKKKTPLPSPW